MKYKALVSYTVRIEHSIEIEVEADTKNEALDKAQSHVEDNAADIVHEETGLEGWEYDYFGVDDVEIIT